MKHRNQRGMLTSKIKEAIFHIFSDLKLPTISLNSPPSTISKWKRNPIVKRCYDLLHQPISDVSDVDETTYITKIVKRVFINPIEVTDVQIAYTMCVCDYMLNPETEGIQVTELLIKEKLEESLVSFAILYNLMLLDFN